MVALLAIDTTEDWEAYRLGKQYGEPHGTFFTDEQLVIPGVHVHGATIRTGERVNGVGIDITPSGGQRTTTYHRGDGGKAQTLTLNSGERFKCVEAHCKYHGRTRVRFINVTTTTGRWVAGGTPAPDAAGKDCAPDGFQLGGWYGSSGVELDQVGAVWTNN
ncbi:hypothetical protein PHYSODRAFT_490875 [Phytophthora sojae]|uniref:Jacalin-type lectin domain-containing protein n=1 Tax=Phytophthora sojae (strain P6497) TaxID=1094619 RepID=G4ZB13_PHYSP|nr:hypothetical protein PHYSODRAFT_490875 [Phytophthora sojae]EGZ21232.1 hypothetical protein PHYSODRAFT_490875 [Phytophthora sojae]|eukprot:XP_009523949.1 hypothetical protein PHYSODRAFT_490875 [Phytophthora sojae]